MKKRGRFLPAAALTALIWLAAGCGEEKAGELRYVTIRAQNNWWDDTRMENLVLAASELNRELIDEGAGVQIVVDAVNLETDWEEYRSFFLARLNREDRVDILTIGTSHLPLLAKEGALADLSWVRDSAAYEDVYQSLWPALEWNGKYWGVPQDVDVSLLFVNRKILADLGWSREEQEALPGRIARGEFTLEDMRALALRAVEEGAAPYGFLHRPINGQHFYIMGQMEKSLVADRETGVLTVDLALLRESIRWFYDNARVWKISPPETTAMDWREIDESVMYGKTLFWYGHTNNFYEYLVRGLSYRELQENFLVTLYPAEERGGKPVTISNPFAYAVASNTEHPQLIRRLLERVAHKKYQARHAVKTYHLPINKGGAESIEFSSNVLLNDLMYMMDYADFIPSNPGYAPFSLLYFQAVRDVETGALSVDQATERLAQAIAADYGDSIRIR